MNRIVNGEKVGLGLKKIEVLAIILVIVLLIAGYYVFRLYVEYTPPEMAISPTETYGREKGLSNGVIVKLKSAFDWDQTLRQDEADFIDYISGFNEEQQHKIVDAFLADKLFHAEEHHQIQFLSMFNKEEQVRIVENGSFANLDWDGDNMNNYFEKEISKMPYDVYNGRYALLVETDGNDYGMDYLKELLISNQKFLPHNVILLKNATATWDNFKKAISEFSGKVNENDIVYVGTSSHGSPGGCSFKDVFVNYTVMNDVLNGVKAGKMLVTVFACFAESAIEPLKYGICPRVVVDIGPNWIYNTLTTKYGALENEPKLSLFDVNENGYVSIAEIIETAINYISESRIVSFADSNDIASSFYLGDFEIQD